jgi:hypothetical protein
MRLDVVLPKFIQSHRPRETVHLATPTKAALVPDPTDRIETAAKGLFENRVTSGHPPKEFRARVNARHVIHAIEQTSGVAFKLGCNSIFAADEHEFL